MSVVLNGEKYDFECDAPGCGFASREWPDESMATTRGDQHYNEHVTGEPMTELIEFEQSVGFVRTDAAPSQPTVVTTSTGEQISFDAGGNVITDTPVVEDAPVVTDTIEEV